MEFTDKIIKFKEILKAHWILQRKKVFNTNLLRLFHIGVVLAIVMMKYSLRQNNHIIEINDRRF